MQSETDFPPDLRTLERNYELIRELGEGGMAAVYLARHRATGRLVAIKAVRARYLDDPDALQRFAREARTVSGLTHPNIVATEAIEEIGDRAVAIIMEYISGGTVRDRLRESGAFSAEDAESVLRDVASALAYAHRRRIVHRDVKPENIFLDKNSGRALLSDFGIARLIEGDVPITMLGSALGTPQYMSPEQIDGVRVDGRSDIYSLGVVGWELLTGLRPWAGENLYGTIYKQKHEHLPRISSLRPRVPANLLFAIEGALVKDRERRWQTIEQFLEHLTHSEPAAPKAPLKASLAPAKPEDAPTVELRRPIAPESAPPRRRRAVGSWLLVAPLAIAAVSLFALLGDRTRGGVNDETSREVTSSGGAVALDTTSHAKAAASTGNDSAVVSRVARHDSTAAATATTRRDSTAAIRSTRRDSAATATRVARRDPAAGAAPGSRCSNPTIAAQRACLLAYIAVNDAALQRVYDSLIVERRRIARVPRGAPDPPDVMSLRVEQRKWVSDRDRECMGKRTSATGPLWARAVSRCFKELSDDRAEELESALRSASRVSR